MKKSDEVKQLNIQPKKKTHKNKLNEQVHLSKQKRKNNKVEIF